ncbi:MAG: hypothetical protein A2Z12_05410 [Actinobacteria bacterium RBG_16_68_21]|nr:MAG: hypothetical protein A2Z12_05410 [Actinobacteria bacterium RBG_16_68_21]
MDDLDLIADSVAVPPGHVGPEGLRVAAPGDLPHRHVQQSRSSGIRHHPDHVRREHHQAFLTKGNRVEPLPLRPSERLPVQGDTVREDAHRNVVVQAAHLRLEGNRQLGEIGRKPVGQLGHQSRAVDQHRAGGCRRLEHGVPEALTASTCRLLGDGPARRVEQHGDDDCQAEHAVHPAIVTMPIQGSDPPPVR